MKKADQTSTKQHNSQLVLNLIYSKGPISRAEIVDFTSLTAPTISRLVLEFMQDDLVEEVGFGESSGGKRPILLQFNDDAYHLIGLDLGAGIFRGAVINLRGKVYYRIRKPRQGRTGEAALDQVYELVNELIENASRPLLGIGVGTPGLVDSGNGVAVRAVHLNWENLPLAKILRERYGLPVYIANNCQVAVLGEFTFGKYAGSKDIVVINVGYGIGAGIILNKQPLHGDPFGAGEIGHIKVVEGGELCQCGNTGCLETVISRRAIENRVNALGLTTEPLKFDQIVELQACGNPQIDSIVTEVGKYLGIVISNMLSIFGPCRVLISGRVGRLGPKLFNCIQDEIHERYKLPHICEVDIEVASLGTDIVLLGASALVLPKELVNLHN